MYSNQISVPPQINTSINTQAKSIVPKTSIGRYSILPAHLLVPTIAQSLSPFVLSSDCKGAIKIPDLPDLTASLAAIFASNKHRTKAPTGSVVLKTYYMKSEMEHTVKLVYPSRSQFKFPNITTLISFKHLSRNQLKDYLHQLVNSPPAPSKRIPYYFGPPLSSDFDHLLHPGQLSTLKALDGITSPWWYVGEQNSGTAFHFENSHLRSANLALYGYKLWFVIYQSDTAKFGAFLRDNCSGSAATDCDQWLSHCAWLVDPKALDSAGIQYHLFYSRPGDLVVIASGQYHAIVNLTTSFSVTVDFVLPPCGYEDVRWM